MSNQIESIINPTEPKPEQIIRTQPDVPPKAPEAPEAPQTAVLPAKPDTEPPIVVTTTSVVESPTKEEKQQCFYCKADKAIRFAQSISFVLTLLALIYFLIKQASNGRGRK